MVLYYGLGNNIIYPRNSEKYKEIIDDQVIVLIQDAYRMAFMILKECKPLIIECANILKREKILKIDKLMQLIQTKYPEVLNLKISNDK
jgi:ATP-dependent Zn protease